MKMKKKIFLPLFCVLIAILVSVGVGICYENVMAVGSVGPDKFILEVVSDENKTLDAYLMGFSPSVNISGELAYAELGYPENFSESSFTDKIVLLKRGMLNFDDKVKNAYDAGAIGTVIFNNNPGIFFGTLSSESEIPAFIISQADGEYLLDLMNRTMVVVRCNQRMAKTWHVDDDFAEYPTADFSSIQDAIDAADPGDSVYVYNGTYYEGLVINKQLELIGAGKETIIHGGWYDNCVNIMSSNVSVDGFTIKYSGSDGVGLYVSSNNNIITNNTLIENGYGIELIKDSNTIRGNVITNNTKDVYLKGDLNNIISNTIRDITIESANHNKIANNYVTGGIDLESSDHNNIVNNTIKTDINLEMSTYNNIVNNSIKTGITLDARLNKKGQRSNHNTVANNTVKYVSLEGSNYNKIINNTISQNNITYPFDGVNIDYGYYSYRYKAILPGPGGWYYEWRWGSGRVYSEYNEVANNIITSCDGRGIYLGEKSHNTKITNNSINSNTGCGIYLHASDYSDITNNRIDSNQKEGIYLYQSSYNNLTSNEITSNKNGTYLTEKSGKNQITNNSIGNNEFGIHLCSGSSHNQIYHNNFINNTIQAEEYRSANHFDNGPIIGGNYWSDHECNGNPSNGTQPYIIPVHDNQDKYPFENENGWL